MKAITVEPMKPGTARLEDIGDALRRGPDDIKVVVDFGAGA